MTFDSEDKPFLNRHFPIIIKNYVETILMTVSGTLKTPPVMELYITPLSTMPFSNQTSMILHTSERLTKESDGKIYTTNPQASFAVTAHELGHLIFYENAKYFFNFLTAKHKLESQLQTIQSEFHVLMRQLEVVDDEKSLVGSDLSKLEELKVLETDLTRKYLELKEKQTEIQNQLDSDDISGKFRFFMTRKTPYDEFFADVIAELFNKKPNAVYDAIAFSTPHPKKDKEKKKKKDKDEHEISSKEAHLEDKRRQFEGHISNSTNPHSLHGIFGLTREYLFELYLKRPSVQQEKGTVLQAVFQAVVKDIQWTMENYPSLDPKENKNLVNELNLHLQNSIDDEMKKLGIN